VVAGSAGIAFLVAAFDLKLAVLLEQVQFDGATGIEPVPDRYDANPVHLCDPPVPADDVAFAIEACAAIVAGDDLVVINVAGANVVDQLVRHFLVIAGVLAAFVGTEVLVITAVIAAIAHCDFAAVAPHVDAGEGPASETLAGFRLVGDAVAH
jgi:hypothetical protein